MTATPEPGVTVGTPAVDGRSITITLANGTHEMLKLSADDDSGAIKVDTHLEHPRHRSHRRP